MKQRWTVLWRSDFLKSSQKKSSSRLFRPHWYTCSIDATVQNSLIIQKIVKNLMGFCFQSGSWMALSKWARSQVSWNQLFRNFWTFWKRVSSWSPWTTKVRRRWCWIFQSIEVGARLKRWWARSFWRFWGVWTRWPWSMLGRFREKLRGGVKSSWLLIMSHCTVQLQ